MKQGIETSEQIGDEMKKENLIQGFLNFYVDLINNKKMTEDQAYKKIRDSAYKVSFEIGTRIDVELGRKPRENHQADEPGEDHDDLVREIKKVGKERNNWAHGRY